MFLLWVWAKIPTGQNPEIIYSNILLYDITYYTKYMYKGNVYLA